MLIIKYPTNCEGRNATEEKTSIKMNYIGNHYLGDPAHTVWVENVFLEEKTLLAPRNDLINHSPTGFSWGYHGSGPAQLALAILANEFSDEVALRQYDGFKRDIIARLPGDKPFDLRSTQIKQYMFQIAKNRRASG